MQPPDARDVGDLVKTLAAGGGILAACWAAWAKWRRRCSERRARHEAEARAIRYLVDAQHHVLRLLNHGVLPQEEMARQEVLIRQIREELARCDGHEDLLRATDEQAEIVRVLTRTQAIQQRKAQLRDDNPFRDRWTPEGDK